MLPGCVWCSSYFEIGRKARGHDFAGNEYPVELALTNCLKHKTLLFVRPCCSGPFSFSSAPAQYGPEQLYQVERKRNGRLAQG